MNTAVAKDLSLSEFIKQNKNKIYEAARKNTKLNQDGKPTISKDDEWFHEDIWDQHFKKDCDCQRKFDPGDIEKMIH